MGPGGGGQRQRAKCMHWEETTILKMRSTVPFVFISTHGRALEFRASRDKAPPPFSISSFFYWLILYTGEKNLKYK